jgi:hypothetical protein
MSEQHEVVGRDFRSTQFEGNMDKNLYQTIVDSYSANHDRIIGLVTDLTNEQVLWRPSDLAPSIGFHVWHLGRWADLVQEVFNGPGTQVWIKDKIATLWGFSIPDLGFADTGKGIDEDTSASLPLPPKETLVEYVRSAFAEVDNAAAAAAKQHVQVLKMNHLAEGYFGAETPAVEVILNMAGHDNRHLGMIQMLRGLQGVDAHEPISTT